MQRKFDEGERNPDFLTQYNEASRKAALPAKECFLAYIETQKPENWIQAPCAEIIMDNFLASPIVDYRETEVFKKGEFLPHSNFFSVICCANYIYNYPC